MHRLTEQKRFRIALLLTCKDICDNATRHIDCPTSLWERVGLHLHLLACKECRRFMRQFRMVIAASAELNELEQPTDEEIETLAAQLASRRH